MADVPSVNPLARLLNLGLHRLYGIGARRQLAQVNRLYFGKREGGREDPAVIEAQTEALQYLASGLPPTAEGDSSLVERWTEAILDLVEWDREGGSVLPWSRREPLLLLYAPMRSMVIRLAGPEPESGVAPPDYQDRLKVAKTVDDLRVVITDLAQRVRDDGERYGLAEFPDPDALWVCMERLALPRIPKCPEKPVSKSEALGLLRKLQRWLGKQPCQGHDAAIASESDAPSEDDPLRKILAFAKEHLTKTERRMLELICQGRGEEKVANMASDEAIKKSASWEPGRPPAEYKDAWNGAKNRINKKLAKARIGWKLVQHTDRNTGAVYLKLAPQTLSSSRQPEGS